jgi:hypothetical protein
MTYVQSKPQRFSIVFHGPAYDGDLAWLEQRGWYIETYDAGVHFIVLLPPMEAN